MGPRVSRWRGRARRLEHWSLASEGVAGDLCFAHVADLQPAGAHEIDESRRELGVELRSRVALELGERIRDRQCLQSSPMLAASAAAYDATDWE